MTKLRWLIAFGLCALALYAGPARACRYNVHEVGFIDVGIEPYWLFVYVPADTGADAISDLRDTLDAAFIDTNIRCEPIAANADANHPAMEYLQPGDMSALPVAVLVCPDGQSMPVPLPDDGGPLAEAVCTAMEEVLYSPVRQQILETAAQSYGVVLLLEGPQPERNAAAKEAISAAIAHVGEQLEFLPKPMAHPPEMVVVDQQSLAKEGVLLWTLGLTAADVNEPHAAILYGRARWLGPLFKGDILTADHLMEILFIIGADCECGLDHRWLQGTMLPARWDATLQQKAAENLGFDPENPMIKMEMVSIIRRGMGGFAYPSMPLGYREMEVGEDIPVVEPELELEPEPNDVAHELEEVLPAVVSLPAPIQAEVDTGENGMDIRILAVTLGGMVLLVALGSLIVILRARKV